MKYLIKLKNGKIESHQTVSEKYLENFANDESNPINKGYEVVDSLDGYEFVPKKKGKTLDERVSAIEKHLNIGE